MICLIIPANQVELVQGASSPTSSLEPRLLNNGDYALPARVLEDPAHSAKVGLLQSFDQRDVDLSEFYSEE